MKDLIGKVMTANIDEETFLNELQVALKSPPQPHLLVFLKQSVPVLRNEMQVRHSLCSAVISVNCYWLKNHRSVISLRSICDTNRYAKPLKASKTTNFLLLNQAT